MEKSEQGIELRSPVKNLVSAMDGIFGQLRIDESVFRNPSYNSDAAEKVCGLTNTYMKPTRIGRKAQIGNCAVYYGRKFDLLPKAYEIVEFEVPADIPAFLEKRLSETLTDYMSIHSGKQKLDMDIRNGVIVSFKKIGFDGQFNELTQGRELTVDNLRQIVAQLLG